MQKNNSPLVSIIVPVYNSDKYLEKCLGSILSQTYRKFEIIVVDDGSSDNSLTVAEGIARKDSRARVFSKKNGGVSSARNFGIGKARGDYIAFIDADDVVEDNFIDVLVKDVSDNSMVVCGFVCDFCNNSKKYISSGEITRENFWFRMYVDNAVQGFCCNKLYIRDIIIKNGICFDEKIKNCEDLLFNAEYGRYIMSFVVIPKAPYHYCQRYSSATKKDKNELYNETMRAIKEMEKIEIGRLDKLAVKYMKLELAASCGKKVDRHLMREYLFDSHVPLAKRLKTFCKKSLYPLYSAYSDRKKRRFS